MLGGSILTIANINEPYNDYVMDKTIEHHNKKRHLSEDDSLVPDVPSIFSKYYKKCGVSHKGWLNRDILTFNVQPPSYLTTATSDQQPKLVFFSVAKRDIIGYINDIIDEIFVSQNNIFCFTKKNGFYAIKLDMSYLQQNESKKRKLEEDPTSDENQNKKIKLN